jgi:hypothetical protein
MRRCLDAQDALELTTGARWEDKVCAGEESAESPVRGTEGDGGFWVDMAHIPLEHVLAVEQRE